MKNLLASLGIITLLCFFPASETAAYYCGSIACIENYVWCTTDSGLVKMNKLDGTYQIFSSITGRGIVIDNYIEKWLIVGEGVISFNEEGVINPNNLELKSYTTENGLVDNKVNQIAVDHNNVKWFATPSGVSSFDGTTWNTYTTEDGLTDNNVLTVAVDYRNIKWFGTRWGGVSSYNDTTWTTHQLTFNDITYNHISFITVDSENVVWFGCNRRYDCYERSCNFEQVLISLEGTSLTLHENTSFLTGEYTGFPSWVRDIACGADDKIWYIYYSNVLRYYAQISGEVNFIGEKEYYSTLYSIRTVNVDDEGIVWIGTREGLRSFDGETWTPYTFDFSETNIEAPENPLPFSIRGVYPNPFNVTTTISFTLPASGFTQLVIYNITGQKVRELVAETMTAGIHNVMWDGRDNGGNMVSSGVYISRLSSWELVTHSRILLMK